MLLHCDWVEYNPRQKAIENAEEPAKGGRVEEVLLVLTTVERGDNESTIEKAVEEVLNVVKQVGAKRVLVYPWAHLSRKLEEPVKALSILKGLEKSLRETGLEVYRAPFGWYKELKLSVKGHPLAELSREVKGGIITKRGEKKFIILTPGGEELDPANTDLSNFTREFRIMVEKEALKEELKGGEPKVLDYLRRFGFEWEPFSDYGHMRLGPYATIIFDLASEYSRRVVHELGIPVFEVKGTAFFNLKEKPVREHAELYGDRLYVVETDRGEFVLRYAACHQQFAMIKDWELSYKNLPFGAFEIADSYRYEQSGEVELCFRLRRFYMPDLHVFTRDVEEAKEWLFKIHKKIMQEIEKLGRNYELLINVATPEYYGEYKPLFLKLAKDIGKPVLISIYPPLGLNYYWTVNIEYHILDLMDRPREVGTVQIDIGNAKRFGITYVDKDGTEKYPIILHSAILGSLERFIYALYDTALRMPKPMLPLWISPIQIRILPVKEDPTIFNYSIKIAEKLIEEGFRVDVDDTERSLARKMVDAEREWIPYIIVIGDKEVKENMLSVRRRSEGTSRKMSLEDLISELKEQVKDYPQKRFYTVLFLSRRPGFIKYY